MITPIVLHNLHRQWWKMLYNRYASRIVNAMPSSRLRILILEGKLLSYDRRRRTVCLPEDEQETRGDQDF